MPRSGVWVFGCNGGDAFTPISVLSIFHDLSEYDTAGKEMGREIVWSAAERPKMSKSLLLMERERSCWDGSALKPILGPVAGGLCQERACRAGDWSLRSPDGRRCQERMEPQRLKNR